ncbi:hypothetical protein M758_7G063700 [Ceratodon purpureus]|nr:hypothetical protein M758_7G063700 [Ceratodon purpureus]
MSAVISLSYQLSTPHLHSLLTGTTCQAFIASPSGGSSPPPALPSLPCTASVGQVAGRFEHHLCFTCSQVLLSPKKNTLHSSSCLSSLGSVETLLFSLSVSLITGVVDDR